MQKALQRTSRVGSPSQDRREGVCRFENVFFKKGKQEFILLMLDMLSCQIKENFPPITFLP